MSNEITLDYIIEVVFTIYDINIDNHCVFSQERKEPLPEIRRMITKISLEYGISGRELASLFNRDNKTSAIFNSRNKANDLIKFDKQFRSKYEKCMSLLLDKFDNKTIKYIIKMYVNREIITTKTVFSNRYKNVLENIDTENYDEIVIKRVR